MDWMKLKSGSDVRGVAVGENAPLTEHVAMCLGMAFARYVAKHVGKPVTQVTIAIGRDSRISGPALLHVKIDVKANVWPLVPPNQANSAMLDSNPAKQAAAPASEKNNALPA